VREELRESASSFAQLISPPTDRLWLKLPVHVAQICAAARSLREPNAATFSSHCDLHHRTI